MEARNNFTPVTPDTRAKKGRCSAAGDLKKVLSTKLPSRKLLCRKVLPRKEEPALLL